MIKALFTALTGIHDSSESPEEQAKWERQRYLDIHDLDDDDDDVTDLNDSQADDDDDDSSDRKGWFGLW